MFTEVNKGVSSGSTPRIYLYKEGIINQELTGGFKLKEARNGNITYNSNHMVLKTTYHPNQAVLTTNSLIDLTDYKYIYCEGNMPKFSMSGHGAICMRINGEDNYVTVSGYYGPSQGTTGDEPIKWETYIGQQKAILCIDITNLTGGKEILIHSLNTQEYVLNNIWLES